MHPKARAAVLVTLMSLAAAAAAVTRERGARRDAIRLGVALAEATRPAEGPEFP
jgi:hypothetical protein